MESVGQRHRAGTTRYKMRVMMVVFADIITTFIAYFFALWLRFDVSA